MLWLPWATRVVAIHNKNGQGLLPQCLKKHCDKKALSQSTIKMDKGYYTHSSFWLFNCDTVAIHNKNGQGLLPGRDGNLPEGVELSQSTIKMDKGYYLTTVLEEEQSKEKSQSTIKMDKGYYFIS